MTENTTKTVVELSAKQWAPAFEGDAPFTDSVPHVPTEHEKRFHARAAKRRARKVASDNGGRCAQIRRELNKYAFNSPLTEAEGIRTKKLIMDPALRRDAGPALLYYFHARFSAGGYTHVLTIRKCYWVDAANAARIADVARVLFWKYRRASIGGTRELTDSDLNYSLARVREDIERNPNLVILLEAFKTELLELGYFSDTPITAGLPLKAKRRERHTRVATIQARTDELATQLNDAKAQQLTDAAASRVRMDTLTARLDALSSQMVVFAGIVARTIGEKEIAPDQTTC